MDNNAIKCKFPNFPFPFFPTAFQFPIFPFPFFPFPFYPDPQTLSNTDTCFSSFCCFKMLET